jgi:two-component system, cell cycle response regulator
MNANLSLVRPAAATMELPKRAAFDELKAGDRLPSPKGVALQLMQLARRDDVTLSQIAQVVQGDPALSGRLLKLANSAASGANRPVVFVPEAVQRLGMTVVQQVALGFSLLSDHRTGTCEAFDYSRFWSRSLATAIAATSVARRVGVASSDECFTLGLVAGIGQLALASVYPAQYTKLLEGNADADDASLRRAEREHFAIDHAELTTLLMEQWGIPQSLIQSVSYHLKINVSEELSRVTQIGRSLDLAAHIASVCVAADSERPAFLAELYRLGARVGIDEATLSQLLSTVVESWSEWGKMVGVNTRSVPSLDQLQSERSQATPLSNKAQLAEGSALKVLAVDDNKTMLKLVTAILEELGHSVHTASDGQEALGVALEDLPQLLIADWDMPGLNGIELCKSLRSTEAGRYVYIIVLTGRNDDALLEEAFSAGADDYITKPLNPRELTARIRACQRFIQLQAHLRRDTEEIRRLASELSAANRRLQVAALTDALTGLPNRRYALERSEQEVAAARRSGQPLALMMVDIDHFKSVNDRYGHDVGDAALRHIATIFRAGLRTEDQACRLGGEEFLIIARQTDGKKALIVADRLRRAIALQPLKVQGDTIKLTVSIGCAAMSDTLKSVSEILKSADEALYRAKRLGRDRVEGNGEAQ